MSELLDQQGWWAPAEDLKDYMKLKQQAWTGLISEFNNHHTPAFLLR